MARWVSLDAGGRRRRTRCWEVDRVGAKVRDGAGSRASGLRGGECGCGHAHADAGPSPLVLPDDLRGRPAVVTGAARGIGEAIARWLIMARADVTVVDKDQKSLKLAFGDEPCQILEGDLGADDVVGLADDLARQAPVELIVNNVGVSTRHGFLDIGMPEFDEVLQTNLRGPWFFTRRLVDAFLDSQRREARRRRHRHGSIV